MGCRSHYTFKKWSTVIGACLLMIPIGLPHYWGNMSNYTLSYFLIRLQTKTGIETQWVMSLYVCCQALGFVLVGMLSKYTGKRLGVFFGMVLFLSGIFGTYFALKTSIIVMNLTLGVISGLGCGFVNGMALEYAVPWAGKHLGLVTSLVQSGFTSGPILINGFITMLTNPQDKRPDFSYGPSFYFSQQDVLDNVPYSYLVFGCLCLGIQSIGFLMVREYDTGNDEIDALGISTQQYGVIENTRQEQQECAEKSPKEMIKTLPFYGLWFACLFYTNSIVIVLNYYKSYGQLWISDDHFLTMLGTTFTISVLVSAPLWGAIVDRIGAKNAMVLMFSKSTFYILFLYFAPRLSKWLYLVGMIMYGSSSCSIFFAVIAATCKLFGQTHQSSNVGVVSSSDIIMVFITPPVMELILINYGWFYLLCVSACLNLAGLGVVIFTLP